MRELKLLALLGVALALSVAGAARSEPTPSSPAPDPAIVEEAGSPYEDYDAIFDDDDLALELERGSIDDPLENMNRWFFAFNRTLDDWAFEPVTDAYQLVTPEGFRKGVHNFFLNLESPVVFTNQLLQARPGAAGQTLGRFLVNSTAGAGGLMDAAERGAGWPRVDADFGQTLARWGTPTGPYLVVPVLGPSSVRDLLGDVVDRLIDPLTYFVGPLQWWIPLGVSQGLAVREANSDALKALEESSIDFYSALRSAYAQSREADVQEALGAKKPAARAQRFQPAGG